MLAILISLNISGFQKEVDIVKRFYFSCKCTCWEVLLIIVRNDSM